jgi:hypothetical protein
MFKNILKSFACRRGDHDRGEEKEGKEKKKTLLQHS